MEQVGLSKISADLDFLKMAVAEIQQNMIDRDCILTPKEDINFEKSLKELEQGQTTSLEDLEKEREENA